MSDLYQSKKVKQMVAEAAPTVGSATVLPSFPVMYAAAAPNQPFTAPYRTWQPRGRSRARARFGGNRGMGREQPGANGCRRCGSNEHWVRECPHPRGGAIPTGQPPSHFAPSQHMAPPSYQGGQGGPQF